jgi:hypothetical protein
VGKLRVVNNRAARRRAGERRGRIDIAGSTVLLTGFLAQDGRFARSSTNQHPLLIILNLFKDQILEGIRRLNGTDNWAFGIAQRT